jgi:hypothetical protein
MMMMISSLKKCFFFNGMIGELVLFKAVVVNLILCIDDTKKIKEFIDE